MTTQKAQKKRILNVISYYRLLTDKEKGEIKVLIMDECDFSESTFQKRMRDTKIKKLELKAIEAIIAKHKEDGTQKH